MVGPEYRFGENSCGARVAGAVIPKKTGPIGYTGPILAGNRLIVASTQGALIFADPATGTVQGQTDVGESVSLSPVVAANTLYVLDDRGRLHAFR